VHPRLATAAPESLGACAQLLPGGYTVGEKVFCTVASRIFPDLDKVVHGQQGVVTGPAIGSSSGAEGKGVTVLFPGNTASVNCYLTSVCRLRAASAATPRLAAPRTRAAAHCSGAGGLVVEGVVRAGRFGAAPERAVAELYASLLLTAGGRVRR
jgi:hypothetical protein